MSRGRDAVRIARFGWRRRRREAGAPRAAARGRRAALAVLAAERLASTDGDPFAAAAAFGEWLEQRARAERDAGAAGNRGDAPRHSLRRWCAARRLRGTRLVDIAKLRTQFLEALASSGVPCDAVELARGAEAGARDNDDEAARARPRGDAKRRRAAQREVRELRRARAAARDGRLTLDDAAAAAGGAGDDALDDGEESDEERLRRLELLASNVDAAAATESGGAAAAAPAAPRAWALLKLIVASGLYPNVALADVATNARRPQAGRVFATREAAAPAAAYLLPTSVLAAPAADGAPSVDGTGRELLFYRELVEHARPFLSCAIALPALATTLLLARRVDTDAGAPAAEADDGDDGDGRAPTRLLVDGWLLFELRSAVACAEMLRLAARLRVELAGVLDASLRAMLCDRDAAAPDGAVRPRRPRRRRAPATRPAGVVRTPRLRAPSSLRTPRAATRTRPRRRPRRRVRCAWCAPQGRPRARPRALPASRTERARGDEARAARAARSDARGRARGVHARAGRFHCARARRGRRGRSCALRLSLRAPTPL